MDNIKQQETEFGATNAKLLQQLQGNLQNKKFTIFDDETQPDFELVTLSNRNIKKVCLVKCNSAQAEGEERIYYAQLGEIMPDKINEEGNGVYKFKDTYHTPGITACALAQAMFKNFPEVVEVNADGVAEVKNMSLFDSMLRDQVESAFIFFLSRFGWIPYGQANLLSNLANDQTGQTIGQKILKQTLMKTGSKKPGSDGHTKQDPTMENGNS